MEKTVR